MDVIYRASFAPTHEFAIKPLWCNGCAKRRLCHHNRSKCALRAVRRKFHRVVRQTQYVIGRFGTASECCCPSCASPFPLQRVWCSSARIQQTMLSAAGRGTARRGSLAKGPSDAQRGIAIFRVPGRPHRFGMCVGAATAGRGARFTRTFPDLHWLGYCSRCASPHTHHAMIRDVHRPPCRLASR